MARHFSLQHLPLDDYTFSQRNGHFSNFVSAYDLRFMMKFNYISPLVFLVPKNLKVPLFIKAFFLQVKSDYENKGIPSMKINETFVCLTVSLQSDINIYFKS